MTRNQYFITFYVTDGENLDTYFDMRHVGPFASYKDAQQYARRVKKTYPTLVMSNKGGYGVIIDVLQSRTFGWIEDYLK